MEMSNQKTHDVVATIGGFQSPYLHIGHRSVIKRCFAMAKKKVIIFIYDQEDPVNDPLSFEIRKDMIKDFINEFVDQGLAAFEIKKTAKPFSEDDVKWSRVICEEIVNAEEGSYLLIGGSRLSGIYAGMIEYLEIPEIPGKSATEIRNNIEIPSVDMFSEREKQWFRAGMIYKHKTTESQN